MARIREQINSIDVTQELITVRPAVGRTWCDVHIEHGTLTLAEMRDIKIYLVSDTETVLYQEYANGEELNKINQRYKRHTKAGTLSFYFRLPEQESEALRMSGALGTGGLQQWYIEFKKPGATAPGIIRAWGKKTKNRPITAGIMRLIVNHNRGGNAEGNNHYDEIGKRDRINCIHVLNPHVQSLKLMVDGAVAYDLDRDRANFDEDSSGRRNSYADDYGMAIDFTMAGVLDEALVMQGKINGAMYQAQEMRLTVVLDNGESVVDSNIRYLIEYQTNWAGISRGMTKRAA